MYCDMDVSKNVLQRDCSAAVQEGSGQQPRISQSGRSQRRVAAAAFASVVLLSAILVVRSISGNSEPGTNNVEALQLDPKSLAAMMTVFREDPGILHDWAKATGVRESQLLMKAPTPAAERREHGDKIALKDLDKDVQLLTQATENITSTIAREEKKPPVIKTDAAWMIVKDLSTNWDMNSNFSLTPWEFCADRHLSQRQIRDCAEHLIKAAGVKYHRDLNLDSKVYDKLCEEVGHTFVDARGSMYALPRGTKAMCERVIIARNNVDELMKRQVTTYAVRQDPLTGSVQVPLKEVDGSHGVSCSDVADGCR